MDMSNATAAGPSQGLLDIIFGGKPEEANEADGPEFKPLMEMIKALKEKAQEEISSRTDEETAPGKGMVDYRAVGMPGWLPNTLMEQPPQAEVDSEAAGLAALMAAVAGEKPQAALEKVDPSQVNRILTEKSLPTLNADEVKILQAVNDRIALAAQEATAAPASEGTEPKAAQKSETPQRAALLQELVRKGIDPNLLKGQEGLEASAAPEKFLSTEAYLQMHERFAKTAKEEGAGAKRLEVSGDENATVSQLKDARAMSEVTETGKKGDDLFGKAGREAGDLLKGEAPGRKLDSSILSFDANLQRSLKAEVETKDILLPGTKPEQIREKLVGEVALGVNLQALKGGGEMRLVINPPELGEIKLQIGTVNGRVEVQVTTQNEEVAGMIRGGSKQLESSLRDQNLSLAKFDVTVTPDAPVAATDTRSNLSDQFLQQNPNNNGFNQQAGAGDGGGFNRWDGNQNQRQGSESGFTAEEQGRSAANGPASSSKSSARDGSRRLDVVA